MVMFQLSSPSTNIQKKKIQILTSIHQGKFCNLRILKSESSKPFFVQIQNPESSEKQKMDEEQSHALYAMQLVSSSVLPMVLKTATDLGLFDIIAESGPASFLSASQIASRLAVQTQHQPDASSIDRILRCLASYSIVRCSVSVDYDDGEPCTVYGLGPVSKYFTRNRDEGSLAPMLNLFQDKAVIDIWYTLKDAVLEGGIPFNRAHGMNAVEFVGRDSRFRDVFHSSMRDFNGVLMKEILRKYTGFDGVKSLVDVGGGNGSILNMIISNHPHMKGINFDLPSAINSAPSYPGIEHVSGDMFASIPDGEAVFMKWILHSWNDEQCVDILRNCYQSLPPQKGKVIVVDMVVPDMTQEDRTEQRSMFQFELFLFNMNPSGKERTKLQFESLAKSAGFSHVQVSCSAFCFSVMEFHKKA
ncbi:PREDICTED: caffeic acid 3-O-methyltransferase 1 [Tarenaya hassleriana]|uniref:caffeic acid 3-O-methyltransferase 1 n=1 Tax=Tarenaya hassleriana TaxID=28532 RepID=UPI00053C0EA2|nr:PREDICTED: caffeic acid 3-O-methyltransferase 1 [Tarenaya hassleriana]